MSDTKRLVAASLLSAILAVGIGLPLGYLGLRYVPQHLDPGGAQSDAVTSVIIELKDQALADIAATRDDATKAIEAVRAEENAQRTADVGALTAAIEALKSEQAALRAQLDAAAAPPPMALDIPGQRPGTFNRTVFFALGEIEGASVDSQIAAAVTDIDAHAAGRPCSVNVLGFSDTLGGDISNLQLSQKRAEHVATQVRAAGLEVGDVEGWGERWLNVHTLDGVKNEKNRRVVLETSCTDPAAAPANSAGS